MKSMKNKKGWLRVVEASLAIIIMVSFVIITMNRVSEKETDMQEKANNLVLEIEKNQEIREKIFDGTLQNEDLINLDLIKYNFCFKIDEVGENPDSNKEIFAASVILKSINQEKEFTLYIWE